MADIVDKEKRSYMMQRVKSSNNKSTELKLIEIFKKYSITGWRRRYKIKGSPDFVFHRYKIVVFTDGCFWHGHDCRNTTPKDNSEYWSTKIKYNVEHDLKINSYLSNRGWKIIRIWECELKNKSKDILLTKLSPLLSNQI